MISAPGDLIRDARRRSALTQAELARRAGTRQSAVSAYETGKREPSISTLQRLLAAAGFDLQLQITESSVASKRLPTSLLAQRLEARRDDVIATIERYGGRNVRVFGSLARGNATPESDLDLLVDLPPQTGILTLGRIARDVEAIMGLETEVVPTASLRAAVRDHVLAEAIPL